MKKTLATINAQLNAIDEKEVIAAKKLLAKVASLKQQRKEAQKVPVIKKPSIFQQIQELIERYSPQFYPETMWMFLDKNFSKEFFGTRYPLFVEIPQNASESDKRNLKYPNEDKNPRYATKEFEFVNLPGRQFYMTNDVYPKNLEKIQNVLRRFFKD